MKLQPPDTETALPEVGDDAAAAPFGGDISVRGFKRAVVFLVLLGLVARIGFFVEHAQTVSFGVPTLDQKYYDTAARMILAGEDLRGLRGFRPLLYPLFLAANYWVGGSWGVDLAIFVQHLMGVATGVLAAALGARLFRHRLAGVLGGGLFLLAPVPLYLEGELLIEPSYTFLICFGLWLHLCAVGVRGWRSALLWLAAGGVMALAAQARANILVFLAVYPLVAGWRWACSRKPAALLPLTGLAAAFAMLVLWGFIHIRQTNHFHLIPTQGGVNLYLGNKRTADGMIPEQECRTTYGERYEDSVEVWAKEEYERTMLAQGRTPSADPMAVSKYWTGRALDEIKASPASWLRLMAKKTWLMLWNAEVPNNKSFAFLQGEYGWLRWLPGRWVLVLALAPAGLWAAWKRGNRDAFVILFLYVILYSAGNIAFFICDRYRHPVWPVMAAFAGGGVWRLWAAIQARRLTTAGVILASMAAMSALSLHNWFDAKLPSYARDYFFRAAAAYEKGRFAEALEDIRRSVELDPTDSSALHHHGNVLFALNRFEEAISAYEQTLKLKPDEPGAWNNLGAAFEALGRTEDAMQAFRRATSCQPPSKNAFLSIVFIQLRSGLLDDASRTLDQLAALPQGRDATLLATYSVLERRRGNAQQADALEREARALDPNATAWAIERATKPAGNP